MSKINKPQRGGIGEQEWTFPVSYATPAGFKNVGPDDPGLARTSLLPGLRYAAPSELKPVKSFHMKVFGPF